MTDAEKLEAEQIEAMKKNLAPIKDEEQEEEELKEEEAPEEPKPESEPAPAEEDTETEDEPEGEEPLTEREKAYLKEISRLKKGRREETVDTKLDEIAPTVQEEPAAEVTPAEARLFTSWRDEALEELVEKYPQYRTDPKLWAKFQQEYSERVPELAWAKRNKVSVTKALFKDRLMRIHRSLGEPSDKTREEGKKDLLKAQAAAGVMSAGNGRTSNPSPEQTKPKGDFLRRSKGGLESWKTPKK